MNHHLLPPHIAFSQSIEGDIAVNLSHSGGQSLTVNSLLAYCDGQRSSLAELELCYATIQGEKSLRQVISTFHQETYEQTWVKAKHVITFAGAQEALRAVYQGILSPGDHVVVMTPSYPSLQSMAIELGATLHAMPLSFDKLWQPDWLALEAAITSSTKLVVINSPHNPTGMTIGRRQLERIVERCQAHDCYLIIDDVSQATQYQKRSSERNVDYDKTVFINVMSKSFGLAGIRLGWAVTKDKALKANLLAQKVKGSICTSAIDEYFAELALINSQRILARNTKIVEENIQLFKQFLMQFPEISWHQPRAGFLSVIKFSESLLNGQSMEDWAKQLAEKTGVLLLPTSLFSMEGPYCRLGLGQKNFADGLERLGKYLTD